MLKTIVSCKMLVSDVDDDDDDDVDKNVLLCPDIILFLVKLTHFILFIKFIYFLF